jgi:hypothetical protein
MEPKEPTPGLLRKGELADYQRGGEASGCGDANPRELHY